jgi:hypothetical protein
MKKNQRLSHNVITPTTKSEEHDEPISPADIVGKGLMSQEDWDKASSAALQLFAFGQQEAASRGLLLVDTKYELGKDADGNILLLDEVRRCCSGAGKTLNPVGPAHKCCYGRLQAEPGEPFQNTGKRIMNHCLR